MIEFDDKKCVGCGACVDDCFPDALELRDGRPVLANPDWCLRCGHCIALCPMEAVRDPEQDMTEVRELPPEKRTVSPEALLDQMQFRRATRHFKAEPVPEDVLVRILNAGRWSPTAKNRQSTSFLVVRDSLPALKKLAVDRLGDVGMVMLMKGCEPDMARRAQKFIDWKKAQRKDPDFDPLFFHAPMLLLALSDEEGRLDAAAAAAYMEMEAVASGLGVLYSGYFTAAAQGCREIETLLGLPEGQSVVRCLVLGWPDITFRRIPPRDPAKVRYL